VLRVVLSAEALARGAQQLADPLASGIDVRGGEVGVDEARPFRVQRRIGCALAGLVEVPEQLVHLPGDPERREHRRRDLGRAPVAPGEGGRDALARAEAVEHRAPGEAAIPQVGVDGAPEVRLEVGAGGARGLVDREVRRPRERGRDAAQPHATRAVRTQLHHSRPR